MKANDKRKVFGDAVDLLMDEIEEREVLRGTQLIQIKNIQIFHDHPFHLYEGERLEDTIVSVKEHGILNPVIVQKIDGKYEMLSGHNRMNVAKLAGHGGVTVSSKPTMRNMVEIRIPNVDMVVHGSESVINMLQSIRSVRYVLSEDLLFRWRRFITRFH